MTRLPHATVSVTTPSASVLLLGKLSVLAVAWTLLAAARPAQGFSSYMTTPSGCMIDLDTTEVVMNHPIQASPAWSDAAYGDLKLIVAPLVPNEAEAFSARTDVEGLPADRAVIYVDKLPTTVLVKVQGDDDVLDAQYVLQAGAPAAFGDGGQCHGQSRWSGRVGDAGAELTVTAENVQVWAGWAAGHEAVKLLPGYIFRLDVYGDATSGGGGAPAATADETKKQGDWIDFMTTEVGCTSVQLSDSPAQVFERNVKVSGGNAAKLSPGDSETNEIENSVAYHVEFESSSSSSSQQVDQLVVEVTAGASFSSTFHTATIGCANQRIVWPKVPSESFVVGTLSVKDSSKATHLDVRALYSVQGEDTLYITPTLTIRHVPDSEMNVVDDQSDMEGIVDPQKALEQGFKSKMDPRHLQGQIEAHNERIRAESGDGRNRNEQIRAQLHDRRDPIERKKYEEETDNRDRGDLEEHFRNDKERRPSIEKKDHKTHFDEKAAKDRGRDAQKNLHEQVHARADKKEALLKRYQQEPKKNENEERDPLHGLHEKIKAQHRRKDQRNHHVGISIEEDQGVPSVSFDSAYFGALAFFVVGTVATLQICRYVSRRGSKGRREL